LSPKQLAAHLQVDRYGDFQLSEAVRPSPSLTIVPREGYRVTAYRDQHARLQVPVLAASVSRPRLFETFLSLLEALGEEVDVVLETSHGRKGPGHTDLHRESIDRPVLESHFCDFEDLLVNDGCTGVAVIAIEEPLEVQFDEHKLLIVYGYELDRFEGILRRSGVLRDDSMKLITEAEHLHTTSPRFFQEFEQLSYRLGVGQAAEPVNW
jgi:hypothetical protein